MYVHAWHKFIYKKTGTEVNILQFSQTKSVSVSFCRFTTSYCISILSSSALRLRVRVYLTQQSTKPAIAFEQRQRFWRSYRPGCRRQGLSVAKGCLKSGASFSPQVIYYSRLPSNIWSASGQPLPRFIHPHISRHIPDSHYDKACSGRKLTAVNTGSFTQHLYWWSVKGMTRGNDYRFLLWSRIHNLSNNNSTDWSCI